MYRLFGVGVAVLGAGGGLLLPPGVRRWLAVGLAAVAALLWLATTWGTRPAWPAGARSPSRPWVAGARVVAALAVGSAVSLSIRRDTDPFRARIGVHASALLAAVAAMMLVLAAVNRRREQHPTAGAPAGDAEPGQR